MAEDPCMNVLFVCTGNVHRSVLAERLLAGRLSDPTAVRVASAGTRARSGTTMDPATRTLLRQFGAEGSGFAARQLTEELVDRADLVLGMEREHRDAAVRLRPGALHRCFTLREFLRLQKQRTRRGSGVPVSAAEDAIPDPWHQPGRVLLETARTIDAAVTELAEVLLRPNADTPCGAVALQESHSRSYSIERARHE